MSLAKDFLSKIPTSRPRVTPLEYGRLRVERSFKVKVIDDYIHENYEEGELTLKAFGGFGLLDGTENLGDAIDFSKPYSREAYKDCRLTEEQIQEVRNDLILSQVYETLTSEWTYETTPKPGSTENGIGFMQTVQVAVPGTALPFSDADVGGATLEIGDEVYTLSNFNDDSTQRKGRVVAQWVKKGTLRTSESLRNNGKLVLRSITAFADTPDTPDGFVYIGNSVSNVDGIPTRDYEFAKGEGEIRRTTRNGAAGLKYSNIVYLTAPGASEPTLGGVTVLTSTKEEASGHLVWSFNSIDESGYQGTSLVDSSEAQRDGAIVYARSAWNQDPAAPGTEPQGYYNTTRRVSEEDGGKKTVLMTWVKVPAAYTEKSTTNFKVPGLVSWSGSSLDFSPGVTKPFVATVSHTFTNSPAASPTMYTINSYAALRGSYTKGEDFYFIAEEFPGYLGGGALSSSSEWFGETVDSATGVLSSDPATIPTGDQNIDFDASVYLSSLTGTRVYRNTTVTITL